MPKKTIPSSAHTHLSYVGHLSQLGGVRAYELSDGYARGVRALDLDTGAGLVCTVLPDRGMDISRASWKGVNLVYRGPMGEAHPAFYDAQDIQWLRGFFGGLLTTCGLTHLGPPGEDQGTSLGLHGRHTHTPAVQVCDLSGWRDKKSYELCVRGVVEDATLFGPKLRLTRTLSSRLGASWLRVCDEVENFGDAPSPLTVLYHINAGYPLLDESARLFVSSDHCEPCDDESRKHFAARLRFTPPQKGFQEQNFLHRVAPDAEGMGHALIVNPLLHGGLALSIQFNARALPWFNHWKMLGCGDYVTGLEPCNVPCENRSALREKGILPFLAPGERMQFYLEFRVLQGKTAIAAFRREMS